ncbi:MAG: hypothetical protein K2Q18_15595, partial [Bdellovibrionales bacterium]|nr:hypothetical protein [Bdellovibrionales bacterium]
SAACFSCHIAAEERGHVFSQMASFNSEVAANPVSISSNVISSFETLKISDKSISDFKKIKQLSKFKEISVYIGPAKQNIFHGSVDEMIPSLIKEAKEKSIPAFFGNKNDKDYSFVIPTKKVCETDKKIFQIYKYGWVPSKKGSNVGSYILNPVERCL